MWGRFGCDLFVILPVNYVTAGVAWAPSGGCFAVGSFDMLRLCGGAGWTCSFNKVGSGSLGESIDFCGGDLRIRGVMVLLFLLMILMRKIKGGGMMFSRWKWWWW